ncbi:hypothetical protein [Endozoicomonas sp. SCSIO W0465]|uniref:hypothetical protein n=1 Tax=Endozoicomonas sp. SCSIO W0465 TaxID=2918516 RepID=UPI00207645C8|nr:hypothetical protein [Endozoicomonas sp. SCSIO W0465]USE37875.1 hypothetical protein MJO57_06695 [Endozoicomonas sp. SCSIO W0465]
MLNSYLSGKASLLRSALTTSTNGITLNLFSARKLMWFSNVSGVTLVIPGVSLLTWWYCSMTAELDAWLKTGIIENSN